MGLAVGDRIPDFSALDQNGQTFHLQTILGKKPLVIFFYPMDHTPGCIKQVCAFRDHYEEFQELGAEVIGISSDSAKRHRGFVSKYRLPFRLLADTDKKVRRLFQVENRLLNLLPGRETYVANAQGFLWPITVSTLQNICQERLRRLKPLKTHETLSA